jgi:type IV pilus assembly protein PilB
MGAAPGVVLGTALREQIGEILVREGRLGRHELAQAIVEARERGLRLGEHLVDAGLCHEQDVAQALADQFGLRYFSLDREQLERALAERIPRAVAERLRVVPLHQIGNRMVVAVADPTDVYATDELQMLLGCRLELVVTELSRIRSAISTLYDGAPNWVEGRAAVEELEQQRQSRSIDAGDEANAPAVEAVNAILRRAIEAGASDVHWVPRADDLLVRIRVDGVMRDLDVLPLSLRASVVARLKVMAQLDIAERRLPQDGRVAITLDGVPIDLRMAVLPSTNGEQVVLRIAYVGRSYTRLADLELDAATRAALDGALHSPGGAIVVAAPTGSGKTTTLYAALAELNDGARTIVSIEDPVEANVDGIVQVEVNSRIGLTFASGLRTILRADPDVIFVGEIRDAETADIAFQAALTGHLVLTTIHAETAAAGVVRLRQLGVDPVTIATTVRCLLSQRLLRRPCRRCGGKGTGGCVECGATGYVGRIAAFEALRLTPAMAPLLTASAAELESAAVDAGMRTLGTAARALAERGSTTLDEVRRVCGD